MDVIRSSEYDKYKKYCTTAGIYLGMVAVTAAMSHVFDRWRLALPEAGLGVAPAPAPEVVLKVELPVIAYCG
mgnify:CR=1 FL=1